MGRPGHERGRSRARPPGRYPRPPRRIAACRDLVGRARPRPCAGLIQIVAIGTTAEDSASSRSMACSHRASSRPWASILTMWPRLAPGTGHGSSSSYRGPAWSPWARRAWTDTGTGRRSPSSRSGSTAIWQLAREHGPPRRDSLPRVRARYHRHLERSDRAVRGVLHSFTGIIGPCPGLPRPGPAPLVRRDGDVHQQGPRCRSGAAARVPLERILVETDSPYLSPQPVRGATNEPARVAITAARLAEVAAFRRLAGSRPRRQMPAACSICRLMTLSEVDPESCRCR